MQGSKITSCVFRSLFILLCVFVSLLWASCSKKETNDNRTVFRYNEVAGIASLDPAFAKDQAMIWADLQLYNGLVQTDKKLNIQPAIAKSWEISSDGLEYRFLLRDDVFFHPHELFKGKKRKIQKLQLLLL